MKISARSALALAILSALILGMELRQTQLPVPPPERLAVQSTLLPLTAIVPFIVSPLTMPV